MPRPGPGREKPVVGVSRCLLGDAVRYDGASKPSRIVIEQLAARFELIPVCPEVEAGLPVPRPPVQLSGDPEQPRVTGRDDPATDITEQMQAFCERRVPQLNRLAGFIFKSRSPSCGLGTTPVYRNGRCITESANGVFAAALAGRYPQMAVIDETGLQNDQLREAFVDTVYRLTRDSGY